MDVISVLKGCIVLSLVIVLCTFYYSFKDNSNLNDCYEYINNNIETEYKDLDLANSEIMRICSEAESKYNYRIETSTGIKDSDNALFYANIIISDSMSEKHSSVKKTIKKTITLDSI